MKMIEIEDTALAEPTLRRLNSYVTAGKILLRQGCRQITYEQLADETNTETELVISDLVSNPRMASANKFIQMDELVIELESILLKGVRETVIVAGTRERVGKLINSWEFGGYNFNIEAVYSPDGIPAHAMQYEMLENEHELNEWGETARLTTAVLDACYEQTQAIADRLISLGINHIWNFSPMVLVTTPGVNVENVIPGYPKWRSYQQKAMLS
ncbi:MAG TPA: hypothetical protein DCR43_08820 [Bacteroidales bacterium]|nr:MAG: hypothetical protein A2X11_04300 [Bacteroidetes bacterium GWE2_42_24]OFY25250.1 MAG: hypothetical protein A2X09_10995 [Bacteroidetes bacterium GWF2_43_11]HAQ65936.1 hypothetical protein [Bacteroidales bacterium]HBZ66952.1 hypothetical protein [Bacteroidales bacterium]